MLILLIQGYNRSRNAVAIPNAGIDNVNSLETQRHCDSLERNILNLVAKSILFKQEEIMNLDDSSLESRDILPILLLLLISWEYE